MNGTENDALWLDEDDVCDDAMYCGCDNATDSDAARLLFEVSNSDCQLKGQFL